MGTKHETKKLLSFTMKKLPIGVSDFKDLIDENYYYIDKTLLIKEFIYYAINNTVSLQVHQ